MKHIQEICTHFNIGISLNSPSRIYGGLLHRMWKFTTEKGIYAVKQLSSNIDINNKTVIKNYELSESIA